MVITPGLERFEGDWVNGECDGYGVHTTSSGTMFSGQWREGVRQGYGVELTGEGDFYVGQWSDDAMDGYVRHDVAQCLSWSVFVFVLLLRCCDLQRVVVVVFVVVSGVVVVLVVSYLLLFAVCSLLVDCWLLWLAVVTFSCDVYAAPCCVPRIRVKCDGRTGLCIAESGVVAPSLHSHPVCSN